MAIKGDMVGRYLTGSDILIQDCNIIITQPTVKTILQFGEDDFFEAVNFFAQIDKMLQSILQDDPNAKILSTFQLLLLIYQEEPRMRTQLENFFYLVFPAYRVKLTENSIDFLQQENGNEIIKGRVNPFNFDILKDVIQNLFLPYTISKEEYNPNSKRASEIAEKLRKGKEKIAAQKNEENISLFASYISILSVGMNMDMRILLEYTPFQLYDTFMRYNHKSAQDHYFSITTIPFADTSNIDAPDEWTENLYK